MNLQEETKFLEDHKDNCLYKRYKKLLRFAKTVAETLDDPCEFIRKDDEGHYYWRATGERV